MKLIYKIIGNITRVKAVTTTLELALAYNNYGLDILDRCGRQRVGAL